MKQNFIGGHTFCERERDISMKESGCVIERGVM